MEKVMLVYYITVFLIVFTFFIYSEKIKINTFNIDSLESKIDKLEREVKENERRIAGSINGRISDCNVSTDGMVLHKERCHDDSGA